MRTLFALCVEVDFYAQTKLVGIDSAFGFGEHFLTMPHEDSLVSFYFSCRDPLKLREKCLSFLYSNIQYTYFVYREKGKNGYRIYRYKCGIHTLTGSLAFWGRLEPVVTNAPEKKKNVVFVLLKSFQKRFESRERFFSSIFLPPGGKFYEFRYRSQQSEIQLPVQTFDRFPRHHTGILQ